MSAAVTVRTCLAGSLIALAPAGIAYAQVPENGFNADNVDPQEPFGDLPVDLTDVDLIDLNAIDQLLDDLTPAHRDELTVRCRVIAENAIEFGEDTTRFCTSVIVRMLGN